MGSETGPPRPPPPATCVTLDRACGLSWPPRAHRYDGRGESRPAAGLPVRWQTLTQERDPPLRCLDLPAMRPWHPPTPSVSSPAPSSPPPAHAPHPAFGAPRLCSALVPRGHTGAFPAAQSSFSSAFPGDPAGPAGLPSSPLLLLPLSCVGAWPGLPAPLPARLRPPVAARPAPPALSAQSEAAGKVVGGRGDGDVGGERGEG